MEHWDDSKCCEEREESELMGRKAKRIALITRKGETLEPLHQNHQTATVWLKRILETPSITSDSIKNIKPLILKHDTMKHVRYFPI